MDGSAPRRGGRASAGPSLRLRGRFTAPELGLRQSTRSAAGAHRRSVACLDPGAPPGSAVHWLAPAFQGASLGKDPALLSTELSASSPSRSLRSRRLESPGIARVRPRLRRRSERGSRGRTAVFGPSPFDRPGLSPSSFPVPPPFLFTRSAPRSERSDRSAGHKGFRVPGRRRYSWHRGVPRRLQLVSRGQWWGGGITSPATKRAGRGARIDAHPRARGGRSPAGPPPASPRHPSRESQAWGSWGARG